MGLKKWLGHKVLAYGIVKLDKRSFEDGMITGTKANEICDKQFKEKHSEDIQKRINRFFFNFFLGFVHATTKDWSQDERDKLKEEFVNKLEV